MSDSKQALIQQYSLTDNKYECELKRSTKNGMEISKYLFEKYNTTVADNAVSFYQATQCS